MAAIRLKPKKFGPVFLRIDEADTILYAEDPASAGTTHPPDKTPVDTLLASLGSCIIRSVQWAAAQQKATLNPFSVTVSGVKAETPPNRVEKIDVTVSHDLVSDPVLADKIVKQAKSICTVSNSLTCDITLTLTP